MMNEELKPCPFCGMIPKIEQDTVEEYGEKSIVFYVKCSNEFGCDCVPETDNHSSIEDAIEAWNTRHEPTCEWFYANSTEEDYGIVSTGCGDKYNWENEFPKYCPSCRGKIVKPERTCTMEKVHLYDEECVEGIECDECGWSEIHDHSETIPYTHCPNCKAKVEA